MLSEGRAKPVYRPRASVLVVTAVVYLACLGAFVTVRAVVGWLT